MNPVERARMTKDGTLFPDLKNAGKAGKPTRSQVMREVHGSLREEIPDDATIAKVRAHFGA